jgi:hypothetical protein
MAEQALEKAATRTPAAITTPDEYRQALLRWQNEHFHVLTPFTNISGLAPAHAIYSSQVSISLDKDQQEYYDTMPFLKSGEVALAKRGLRKIAEGLGISTRLEYISVGVIPHYWHVKAIASYRGIDGAVIEREASAEWDMRDGAVRRQQSTGGQVSESRKNGLRQCEARAINAAIRECGAGIKQAYKLEELKRPFVAVRVMVQPNMNDPEERRIVLERALGGTNMLYPPTRGLPSPADAFEEDEPGPAAAKHVGRSSTTSTSEPAKKEPGPDDPPTVDAVRLVKVEAKSGETKGKKWTRYLVVDSTGVESSTFDQKLAEYAETCAKQKTWVELTTEQNGQYTNLIEITPAGQQPTLLPDPSTL